MSKCVDFVSLCTTHNYFSESEYFIILQLIFYEQQQNNKNHFRISCYIL